MKNMTLEHIAAACQGDLKGSSGPLSTEVLGVVIDSRLVEKGFLFIATPGERVDGHDYIDGAYKKGALAVVCEKEPASPQGPYILVKSSFQALKDIAAWYRMQLDIKVVGITGSVGKTTTKEFIASVLEQRYKVLKTAGNYNNEIGLPLTILKIRSEHEVAVLEMGINNFGEMHRLSEIAKPDIAVITNIGPCHLENLGTKEGVLKAKTEIFDYLNPKGQVVINGNDALLTTIGEVYGKPPIRFGRSSSAEVSHEGKEPTSNKLDVYSTHEQSKGLFGSSCQLHIDDSILQTHIPLPGEHMILNALAAASVGNLLHLTTEEITTGISLVQPVSGRSNILQKDNITIIDDCYNANPVSMMSALDLLSMANTPIKGAILGDMFELGAGEELLHEEVGAYAATKKLDLLVCVGKLSSHMYDGAARIIEPYYASLTDDSDDAFRPKLLYFETREELIHTLPQILKENSTILVKASHGMGFDQVVKALS